MAKHFNDKKSLMRRWKEVELQSKYATQIAFSSQMILSLWVLHNRFGFDQDECERFVNEVHIADNNDLNDMRQNLLEEVGFCVELPHEKVHAGEGYEEERIDF